MLKILVNSNLEYRQLINKIQDNVYLRKEYINEYLILEACNKYITLINDKYVVSDINVGGKTKIQRVKRYLRDNDIVDIEIIDTEFGNEYNYTLM